MVRKEVFPSGSFLAGNKNHQAIEGLDFSGRNGIEMTLIGKQPLSTEGAGSLTPTAQSAVGECAWEVARCLWDLPPYAQVGAGSSGQGKESHHGAGGGTSLGQQGRRQNEADQCPPRPPSREVSGSGSPGGPSSSGEDVVPTPGARNLVVWDLSM